MFRVQRPPLEQIKLIGFFPFLQRMPNFWKYFWSLRNSYKHYIDENRIDITSNELPVISEELLPWEKKKPKTEIMKKDLQKVEDLYSLK